MSVGLDIGTKTIKAVELSFQGDKMVLKAAGAIGYQGASLLEINSKKGLGDISNTIKKLFSDSKIGSRSVSISLPENQVFTRVLKFPLLNDQEVASAVKWEAEEYIPIPIKEAVIEHQVLERIETSNPPQVLVLLIAVSKKTVEKYINVCSLAGLECVGIETELLSAVRSLAPEDKTVLVVDLGARSTDTAIARDGQLFLSRSIPTAGEAFTRSVAQSMGVTPIQAEEYKRTYGLAEEQLEGKVANSLLPIFKSVTEEIKKAIQYYELDMKGAPPTSVFLMGGSSGLPGIASILTKFLNIEVVTANAFSKISVDPVSAKSLANFAPLYPVAVGLAMRKD